MITSAQNPKLKLIRSLTGRPRDRRKAGAFLAEGIRLVEEAMAAGWPFQFVLHAETLNERGRRLVNGLAASRIMVEPVTNELLHAISDTETSQGILAVLDLVTLPLPGHPDFFLIVDQVRDPGNLGTLLRTAAAAGVQAVLIPPETVDPYTPKVVRAGMGAHFRVPVLTMTWDQIRVLTGGLELYLADLDGEVNCWQADFRIPLGLVIGGEATGASAQARQLANRSVSIPMPGRMESLNAGVAGAILMFEVIRQREIGPLQAKSLFPED